MYVIPDNFMCGMETFWSMFVLWLVHRIFQMDMGSRPGWWMWELWWTEAAQGQVFLELFFSLNIPLLFSFLPSWALWKPSVQQPSHWIKYLNLSGQHVLDGNKSATRGRAETDIERHQTFHAHCYLPYEEGMVGWYCQHQCKGD